MTCASLEELPLFEGRPENDTLLQVSLEKHVFPSGDPHVGTLFDVEIRHWEHPTTRKQIIKQLREGGSDGLNEMDPTYYDSKSTFAEDAMACYNKHLRPTGRCPDWRHDSKVLVPKTAAERKDLGLEKPGRVGPKVWLCSFCPANVYMVTKYREQSGAYE